MQRSQLPLISPSCREILQGETATQGVIVCAPSHGAADSIIESPDTPLSTKRSVGTSNRVPQDMRDPSSFPFHRLPIPRQTPPLHIMALARWYSVASMILMNSPVHAVSEMHVAAGKVADEEEVLTRYAPSPVQHDEHFFQLGEALAAFGVGGFADVPGVCSCHCQYGLYYKR